MNLKLREGWQLATTGGITYLYPPDEIITSKGWYMDYSVADWETEIAVYPNGGTEFRVFSDMLEAHEYLLSVGSDSPWEAV